MKSTWLRLLALLLCFSLIFEQSGLAQVAAIPNAGAGAFRPLHLRSLTYDRVTDEFRVLLDRGDLKNPKPTMQDPGVNKVLEYFLIGVALSDNNFQVNLRPDGAGDIISPGLASTDAGKALLEADLQLKKDTAAFTSPQVPEGKQYWDKLNAKAQELFGAEEVNIPALTRPWIVPDEIIIGEDGDKVYIFKANLKVMLEQDHIQGSSLFNFSDDRLKALNEYASSLIRELIIPKLNKEINTARRYASLRQVYYSLIIARWFKQKYSGKGGFYSSLINSGNLKGLTSKSSWSPATYFQEYKDSFSRGEYNVSEPRYSNGGWRLQTYVSGGIKFGAEIAASARTHSISLGSTGNPGYLAEFRFGRNGVSRDGGIQGSQNLPPVQFSLPPLKEAKDISRFGGKTSSLSRLMELGYRVPDGIGIPKEAYEEFIRRLDLSTTINSILRESEVDLEKPETAGSAARRIKEYILAQEMPQDMRETLVRGYNGLTARKGKAPLKVSVRSSAIGEDSDMTAFAGQFLTVLNVASEEEFIEAVKKCWASVWNDNAIIYRLKNGLNPWMAMSLTVQLMLPSEASGIAFSINPLTGDPNESVINAVYGQCEGAVQSTVPADEIRYDNKAHSVSVALSKKAYKDTMIALDAASGTMKRDVSRFKRNRWAISEEQQKEVAEALLGIKEKLGFQVDMEWAYYRGALYLLQARPITTTVKNPFPIEWGNEHDKQLGWALQNLTGEPATPLEINDLMYQGKWHNAGLLRIYSPITHHKRTFNGYVYTSDPARKPIEFVPQFLVHYALQKNLHNLYLRGVANQTRWLKPFFNLIEFVHRRYSWVTEWERWLPGMYGTLDQMKAMSKEIMREPNYVVLHDYLNKFIALKNDFYLRSLGSYSLLMYSNTELGSYCTKEDINVMLQNVDGTTSSKQRERSWAISRLIKADPSLLAELERRMDGLAADQEALSLEGLEKFHSGPAFLSALEAYLDEYGRIAPSFASPVRLENNAEIIKAILSFCDRDDDYLANDRAQKAGKRQAVIDRVTAKAPAKERALVADKLNTVGKLIAYLEEHNFMEEQRMVGEESIFLNNLADRLCVDGILEDRRQILFLTYDELLDLLLQQAETPGLTVMSIQAKVKQRQELFEQQKKLTPPGTIGTAKRGWFVRKTNKDTIVLSSLFFGGSEKTEAQEGAIHGTAASNGVVEGRVKIVMSPDDFSKVEKGDILLCRELEGSWMSILPLVGGIIADYGNGILQHTAINAREYSIPAVIETKIALATLKDGQLVRVDGDNGIVTILETPPSAETETPQAEEVVSSPAKDGGKTDVGGIDLSALKLTRRAINAPGASFAMPADSGTQAIATQEKRVIWKMLRAGMLPSSDRIRNYVMAECAGNTGTQKDEAFVCLTFVFRLQEDAYCPTEPALTELMALLESFQAVPMNYGTGG